LANNKQVQAAYLGI